MVEQPVPEGLHPVEVTHTKAISEELQPMGKTHVGEVCEELSPMRWDLTLELGKSVRSPPPEEQGAAETTCDELTITPILRPPARSGGGGRKMGVKLSLGRKERLGKGVLRSGFISHYPTLI